MQAMLSYVSDLVVPINQQRMKQGSGAGEGGSRQQVLADKRLYSEAVREAVLMWSPLLGLNIPAWAQHGNDSQTLLAAAARGVGGSGGPLTESRPPVPPGMPPKGPPPKGPPPDGISSRKHAVLKQVLADQQKLQVEQDIAMQGAKSILVSKQTLKKLIQQQRELKHQNRDSLRR